MQELELLKDLGQRKSTILSKRTRRFGLFKCSCGVEFETQMQSVRNGRTKSCGCFQPKRKIKEFINEYIKHNKTKHRLYARWREMLLRCHDHESKDYKNYGARGISVCKEWRDINVFIDDMYPTFQEGLTLDRIDNNLGYYKENCRWATKSTQNRNQRVLNSSNTSGYRGVHWNKTNNRFVAQIRVDSIRIYLGSFKTAIEAAKAYDKYVIDNNLEHTRNFS